MDDNDDADDDYDYEDNDDDDDDDCDYDVVTKGGEEVLVQSQPLKATQTQEGFG